MGWIPVARHEAPSVLLFAVVAFGLLVVSQGNVSDDYAFEQSIYRVVEGTDSEAVVYIIRSGPHEDSLSTVAVATSDGTIPGRSAVAWTDYQPPSSPTVTFPTTSVNRVAVNVSIINNDVDNTDEDVHCFTIALSNPSPSGGALGSPALVCIIDNNSFFMGTCPPPQAAIESNGEPVIKVNTGSTTAPVSWTEPTHAATVQMEYKCFTTPSTTQTPCTNGGNFPITYEFTSFNRRILVRYTAYTTLTPSIVSHDCEFYIRVVDNVAPTITCPLGVFNTTEPGSSTGIAYFPDATASDASSVTVTANAISGSQFPIGSTDVQFIATDVGGNINTCTFNVTITDDEDPEFPCPVNMSVNTDSGQSYAILTFETLNVTDNSGESITAVFSPSTGSQFPIGSTTVTVSATDSSSNTGNCSFIVTVVDMEAPNITCPDNMTVSTNSGQSTNLFTVPAVVSVSDNSDSPTLSIDYNGMSLNAGQNVTFDLASSPHVLTYTAQDTSSNSASCDVYITVTDNEIPTITCPLDAFNSTEPGSQTGPVYFLDATANDNSNQTATLTSNATSGMQFDIGNTIVEFVATDTSGNTNECTFVVTVTDDEAPVLECPDNIEVNSDEGEKYATVSWYMSNVTDNSGESLTPMPSHSSGSQFPYGPTTVIVSATDSSSNIGNCTFIVNVLDFEAPNITCPDNMTVSTDPGLNTATFTLPNPMSAFDNSGVFMVNIDDSGMIRMVGDNVSLDLATGQHLLEYTVVDNSMNNATCVVYITVIDTEDPVITCPQSFTVGTDPGIATANATWESVNVTDNSMVSITPVSDSVIGSPLRIGETVVQYNATDDSGNTATCSFTVTVEDMEKPTLENCSALTFYTSPGLASAFVSNIEPDATDNVGIEPVFCFGITNLGVVLDIGTHTFTCVARDVSGLQVSCQRTIIVEDNETPNITCPNNQTLNTNPGQALATFMLPDAASAVDNSESFTISIDVDGNSYSVGQSANFSLASSPHLVQYTATDNFTNSETCDMYISVTDVEAPMITCPLGAFNFTEPGSQTGPVYFHDATANDNSNQTATLTSNATSGMQFNIGNTIVEFVATDTSGNTNECTFVVTVTDNEPPVLECPDNIEVNSDEGENYATVSWYMSNVTDNSGESLTPMPSHLSGSEFPFGPTTVIVSATDSSSNIGNCSFIVNVLDFEAPNITCPDNMTVSTDPGLNTATFTLPNPMSAFDNSGVFMVNIDDSGMIRMAGDNVSLDLATGQHLLEYTVVDNSMNNATCVVYITVIDTEDPVITCPKSFTVGTDPGVATANATWESVNVTDNSMMSITPVSDSVIGSPLRIGDTMVQYNATDGSGNTATCSFTVTVEDMELPTLGNCSALTFYTSPGLASAFVSNIEPDATDNVGIEPVFCFGITSLGVVLDIGTHTFTCVARDFSGLRVSCQRTIIVEDNETPNITCPNNQTLNTNPGQALATFMLPDAASAVDNSESFTISIDVDGNSYSVGQSANFSLASSPHLVQYTATDNFTNSETCDMYINVTDVEAPMITCPLGALNSTEPGSQTGPVYFLDATANDNSNQTVTLTSNATSGMQFNIGNTIVEFVATDTSGNTNECTFVVTVTDDEPPVLECPDNIEVNSDEGENYATVSWYMSNVTDNSGESLTPMPSHSSGSQFPYGPTTVIVSATDSSSNIGNCSFIVNVLDFEAPNITCPDNMTVSTDPGLNTATFTLPNPMSAFDNSGVFMVNIDDSGMIRMAGDNVSLDLATGQHLLEYTVVDNSMNNATCVVYITVIDTEDPVITCPQSFTVGTDPGVATANVTWESVNVTDNSMMSITPVSDSVIGSPLRIGDTMVQYNATDGSGNTATCSFTVTVEDMELPTLGNCSALTFYTSPGLASAFVSNIEPDATDNVGLEPVFCFGITSLGVVLDIGTHTFTCVARDFSGLRMSCQRTIIVEDNETPNITCPNNQTLNTNPGQSFATFMLPDPASVVDNSGNFTISIYVDGNWYSVGQSVNLSLASSPILVQYTATDNSSNSETCDMYVFVNDTERPMLRCPAQVPNNTEPDSPTGIANFDLAVVTDNSGESLQMPTSNATSGSSFPIGVTVVQFVAVDSSGNEGECTFLIIITDNQAPMVQCPDHIMQGTDQGQNYSTVSWLAVNATDNSGESIVPVESITSGSQFPIGLTTVYIDADDSSGRRASCSFYVNVTDDEPPNIECPRNLTVYTQPGQNAAEVSLPAPVSISDNSGTFTLIIHVSGLTSMVDSFVNLFQTTPRHTAQYIASDSVNSATCDMLIYIIDNEDPVLVCPDDQALVVPDGQLNAAVTWQPPQVTDNSREDLEAFSSHDNGTVFAIGEGTTVFYNATDSSGNTGYCNFTVRVIDNVPPVITCPTVAPHPTAMNQSFGPVFWDEPTVTDNVPSTVTVSLLSGPANGSNFDLGDTSVMLLAVDAAGNNDTCTFVVTVVDMEPPVIYNCPEDFNRTTDTGQSYDISIFVEPTAQDNSGSVTVTGSHRSGQQFNIGPTEVVFIAIDDASLTTDCRFTLLVIDNERPTLQAASQCPSDIVVFIEDVDADNMTVTWTDPMFEDNSGQAPTVTVQPLPNGSPFPPGNTTVNITASDAAFNEFVCSFVVTVNMFDRTPPTFSMCPPSVTVLMTDPGRNVASPIDFGLTVSDSGSGVDQAMLTVNQLFQIGNNSVSLSAIDFAGNIAYCNFTLTVHDGENPNITSCPSNQTIYTQWNSPYGVPTWSMPTAEDNSGSVEINCTHRSGESFGIGNTTVYCTATDPSNNEDMCSFVITVIDNNDPVLTNCRENATLYVPSNSTELFAVWTFPTATDNSGSFTIYNATYTEVSVLNSVVTVTVDWGLFTTVTQLKIGHYRCTIRVEDAAGNWAQCVTELWIIDNDDPVLTNCRENVTLYLPPNSTELFAVWPFPTATDNSGSFTIYNATYTEVSVLSTAVTVTVDWGLFTTVTQLKIGHYQCIIRLRDAAGNMAHCVTELWIKDVTSPVIEVCPPALQPSYPTDPNSNIRIVNWIQPNISDNSGATIQLANTFSPGHGFNIGVTTVTYEGVDESGNMAICTFNVTVVDNQPPTVTCPLAWQNNTEPGVNFTIANWPQPTASDNSGSYTLTGTVEIGQQVSAGRTEVWYNVTDEAGNEDSCHFLVTIFDMEPPFFGPCPVDFAFPTDPDQNSANVTWDRPVPMDNVAIREYTYNYLPGSMLPIGDTRVEYNVTDSSGNKGSCSFVVTVEDRQPPSITCPMTILPVDTDLRQNTANVTFVALASDNNGMPSVSCHPPSGTDFQLSLTNVICTATDDISLSTSCDFNVLVSDNEPPVIECPPGITVNVFTHQRGKSVEFPDTNATDFASGLESLSCTAQSGEFFIIGSNDVTCTARDNDNNVDVCSFDILVIGTDDTEPPVLSNCPANISQAADNITITTIVNWTPPNATDNSGDRVTLTVTIQPGSPFGVGLTMVTYTATDGAQLTSTCDFLVYVRDVDTPDIVECPAEIRRATDPRMDTAVVDWTSPSASDNSGSVVFTSSATPGQQFDLGMTVVTYTAVDSDNNMEQCSFTIIVFDDQKPVITGCPTMDLVHDTEPGQNYTEVTWDGITISDNSGNWTVTNSGPSQGRIEAGTHEVMIIAEDAYGNTEVCNFTVRVRDMELPQFANCPGEIVKLVNESGRDAVVTWNSLQITDNVDVDFTSFISSRNSGETFSFGSTTVTASVSDVNGNTNVCTFNVTVSDASLALSNCPTYVRQPNLPGEANAVVTWRIPDVEPAGTAGDRSSTPFRTGATIPIGIHTITYRFTASSTVSCQFMVEVFDNEPPTFNGTCPSGRSGTPDVPVYWTPPTAIDNHGVPTVSPGSHSSSDVFPFGVTTVTYTAIDSAGLEITCSFDVTVSDTQPPVVTCPAGYSVFTDPSRGTATITWPDATATDNGNITSLVSDPPNGSPLTVGPNTIMYTVTDGGQNTHDCSFTITVIDNEPPVFTGCPTEATAIAPTGQSMAVVLWNLPSASDNAITVTVQSFQSSGTLYPLGVTPAFYLATDGSGNKANCSFDITVYDEQTPMISNCPGNLAENTELGQVIATNVVWTPPTATDNDPQFVFGGNNNPPANFPLGVTEVNYTAVDRAGNAAVCVFTVTVSDNEDPVYSGCPASVSIPAVSGTTMANVPWTPPTPGDNVLVVGSTSNLSPNTSFSFGTTVVEYTVTDEAGNTGTCTFNVTILDSNAPMLVNCPSDQIFCADQGTLTRNVNWIEPTSTDAEGAVTLSKTHAPGDTFMHNAGTPTLVTYTATDAANLMATCTFNVIINDCERPVITNCPGAFNRLADAGGSSTAVSWTEPTATDNTGQVVLNKTHAPASTFTAANSPTTVLYVARDPSENTATCMFTVTVTVDPGAPTIMGCPENIVKYVAVGTAQASVTWTAPTALPSTVTLSAPSRTPGSNFNTGVMTTVTYTAMDSFDRMTTCTFTVSVAEDTANPVIQNCPDDIMQTVPQNTTSFSVSWTPPTASDNSNQVSLNTTHDPGFTFSIQATTVTYTATDPFGRSSTCVFTVTVSESTDNVLPMIHDCPPNEVTNNDPGLATAVVTWTAPTATDDQGMPTLIPNRPSGFAFPIGIMTVTYTATDGNNNQQRCSFTVTVIDNQDPTLTNCPESFSLTVIQATGVATATWTLPTAADNSGTVTLTTTMEPGQSLQPGVYPVTYTATDPAQRAVTCTFTVTVQISSGCNDPTPCMNGGTCTALVNNGFNCNCLSTWRGTTCELDVNECAQPAVLQGCTDRGLACINLLDGYSCDCSNGFYKAGNSDNCIQGRTFRLRIVIVEIFSITADFTIDLANPDAVLFLRRKKGLQDVLRPVFNGLNGFAYVRVLFFQSGSIIAEVLVTVSPTSTVTQAIVENAYQRSIGPQNDLIDGSVFKVTPSSTVVREEVCVAGYCQNGGTCTPSTFMYLSSCICPSGYIGERCESIGVTLTTVAPGDGGLSTEAIVAIAIGAAVAVLLLILLLLCFCYAMARQQRTGRQGYLYREDNVDYRHRKRHTNGSVYDIEFRPDGVMNNGYRSSRQFSVPYVATGRENGIPLHQMLSRGEADYY